MMLRWGSRQGYLSDLGRFLALGLVLSLATLAGKDTRTPADFGLRAFKATRVAQRPLKIHGPFVLTARELSALRRIDGPYGPREDADEDEDAGPCRSKTKCGGPKVGDAGRAAATPAPDIVVDSPLPASDPQIAAGTNFLVSTGRTQI